MVQEKEGQGREWVIKPVAQNVNKWIVGKGIWVFL